MIRPQVACTASGLAARPPQCVIKWDRNLKPKLAIMRQCTSVTDRRTGIMHKREMYILHLALKTAELTDWMRRAGSWQTTNLTKPRIRRAYIGYLMWEPAGEYDWTMIRVAWWRRVLQLPITRHILCTVTLAEHTHYYTSCRRLTVTRPNRLGLAVT